MAVAELRGPDRTSRDPRVREGRSICRPTAARCDVMSLDVIWTAEFAANGWIVPLTPKLFPLADFPRPAVATAIYTGRLYAVPFTSNAGLHPKPGAHPEVPPICRRWRNRFSRPDRARRSAITTS